MTRSEDWASGSRPASAVATLDLMKSFGSFRSLFSVLLGGWVVGGALAEARAQSLPVTDGLQVWLRADAGVTETGGRVVGWANQAASAGEAVPPDEATAPGLVAEALNGQPVLRFDGTDDYLELAHAAGWDFSGDFTSWFVVRFDDFATFRAVWAKTVGNAPSPIDYYALPGSGVPRLIRGDGTLEQLGSLDGGIALRAERYLVVGFSLSGEEIAHYLGGETTASGPVTGASYDSGSPLRIGTRDDLGTRFKGDLAELLIYSRSLTATERETVVDYLATKYDLQNLPPTVSLAVVPAGPEVDAGETATLTATAADADGTITQVQFLANGAVFATASAPPYVVRVTLDTSGQYEFTARATDDRDVSTVSDPVTLEVRQTTPPELTVTEGLQLWVKADAGVTRGDGGAVTQWADQSGQGNDAFALDGGFAPIWIEDAINGQAALRFDGEDDFLEIADSDSLSIVGDLTSLFVVRMDDFATWRAVWGKTSVNLPAPTDFYTDPNSGIPRLYRGNGAGSLGTTVGGVAFRAGEVELAGFGVEGTSVAHFLNSRVTSTGVISATVADADTPLRIGTRDDYVTQLKGDLAELLIYDIALSPEDRRSAEFYLAEKYGLPLLTVSNVPPQVTLTSPPGDITRPAPASVTVEATATDSDGAVVRVDFLLNGSPVASATQPPYTAVLEFPAADEGLLTARATDQLGATTVSAPVRITVTTTVELPLPAAENLKLWLRADQGVTEEAGGVQSWEDGSGNSNAAHQPAADSRPQWRAEAVNGQPAIYFDGEDDYLEVAHSASLAIVGDISSFFVLRMDDFDTFRGVWAKTDNNVPRPTDYYVLPGTGIPRLYRGGQGEGAADGANPLVAGEYAIVGFSVAGTTVQHYLNGEANGGGQITAPTADAGKPLRIGTRDDLVTWLRGDLAELIVYNTVLSEADLGRLFSYLGDRYGIAVPSGPPEIAFTLSGNSLILSWSAEGDWVLESRESLTDGAWEPVSGVENQSVTIEIGTGNQFFQLRQ